LFLASLDWAGSNCVRCDKNVTDLDAKQIEGAKKILAEHKLPVTDIASPHLLGRAGYSGPVMKSIGRRYD